MPDLTSSLKSLAGASTADWVGIAPGSAFTAEELGELGRAFGAMQSAVVLAQRIVDPVQMVHIERGEGERQVVASFADALLRDACWRAAEMLRAAGHRAAIVRGLRYADGAPRHRFSFKKAAHLAGLGAIGRNRLLLHPEWGPWVRLRAVVTDAPLPPDGPYAGPNPCTECLRCVEACPTGALRADGIDGKLCERLYTGYAPVSPMGSVYCAECMWACPVGRAPVRWGET